MNTGDLNFKRIGVENMPEVWAYLRIEKGRTCDFSFGGVLMWVDFFDYEYAIYKDTLFIKGSIIENADLKEVFSLPIGKLSLEEAVKTLKKYCLKNRICLEFSAIPEYSVKDFMKLNPQKIQVCENWGDYLYKGYDLATLKGRKYSKKRNHFNQFKVNNSNYSYKRIEYEDLPAIRNFLSEHMKNVSSNSMEMRECRLTERILEYVCDVNPLFGGVLRSTNNVVGFTVGDIKGDTLYVHVEKANRGVPGAYEAINKLFVEDVIQSNSDIKYVNREDDAGDEGLRKAKLSYNPILVLKKYNIIFG